MTWLVKFDNDYPSGTDTEVPTVRSWQQSRMSHAGDQMK